MLCRRSGDRRAVSWRVALRFDERGAELANQSYRPFSSSETVRQRFDKPLNCASHLGAVRPHNGRICGVQPNLATAERRCSDDRDATQLVFRTCEHGSFSFGKCKSTTAFVDRLGNFVAGHTRCVAAGVAQSEFLKLPAHVWRPRGQS
jgi:hypothetical protein